MKHKALRLFLGGALTAAAPVALFIILHHHCPPYAAPSISLGLWAAGMLVFTL